MVFHLPSFLLPARSLCFYVLALLLFNPSLTAVWAVQNVTVDDQDPSIVYSPAGAWVVSANSSLDFGGSHTLTQNPNATAVFRFTGIAIYFLSPLWPYLVNTAVSLDGGPITLIDLVDHSRNDTGTGQETVQSQVVWNATGLNFTQHVLNISVGVGQPFAIVDGLMYTDPNATAPTSSMLPPPSPSTSSSPTSSSTSSSTTDRVVAPPTLTPTSDLSSSASKHIIPVALGTILGILGVFLLMIAMWFFFRRRRRPVSEAWTAADGSVSGSARGHPPPPNGMNGYWGPPHGYPMEQSTQGTWQNGRYGYVGMPPPPMPAGYQYAHDPNPGSPNSRAPNRYQPGYTLSTITEKSTPRSRRTPLAANTPASVQSELAGGAGVGYYSPPPVAPSEVGSDTSRAGPGIAGIGAGGLRAVDEQQEPQEQYYYATGAGNTTGNQGHTGYSGSSSSSTAVASGSGQGHSEGRRHGENARQGADPNLNANGNTGAGAGTQKPSSSSYWI